MKIIVFIITLIIIILFCPFYIGFQCEKDMLLISFIDYFYFFRFYKSYNIRKLIKQDSKTKKEKKFFNKIKKRKELIFNFIKSLWKLIRIEKIVWNTKLGANDACLTGIITGILYTFKYSIIGALVNNKEVNYIQTKVEPCFNSYVFQMDFNCIIRCKLVYIIIAGIKGLKFVKGGE